MGGRGYRRGNAAFTALSLTGMLGFGAMAVDVGYLQVINAQLTFAVEAGALGGSAYFDGTEDGVAEARARAAALVAANPIIGGFTLDTDEIEVGTWSEDDGFAVVETIDEDTAKTINALRIVADHDGIGTVLAGAAFGKTSMGTRAQALAVRDVGGPAGEVECFLPLALPDCAFPDDPSTNPPPIKMMFNNQNLKNIGWAHPDGANADNFKNHFDDPDLCGSSLKVGEFLPLSNGTVSSAQDRIGWILNEDGAMPPSEWPYEFFPDGPPDPRDEDHYAFEDSVVDSNNWGNVIAGPIALVDLGGGPGSCAGNGQAPDKFNQTKEITGFVWGFIYDQRSAGGNHRHLYVQVDFLGDHKMGTVTDPNARGNVTVGDGPPRLVAN